MKTKLFVKPKMVIAYFHFNIAEKHTIHALMITVAGNHGVRRIELTKKENLFKVGMFALVAVLMTTTQVKSNQFQILKQFYFRK